MYRDFEGMSLEGMHNLAKTLRFQFAAANSPKDMQLKSKAVLPIHSRTIVTADGIDVAMDYSSPLILGLVMSGLADTEGLIFEGWKRMEREDIYPLPLVNTLTGLEGEVRRFLDDFRGAALLSVEDFCGISREVGSVLRPDVYPR